MSHRITPVVAALVAAGVLLTGCGGGGSDDKSKKSDEIAGVDEGGKKESSPSGSPAGADVADRPKIELPKDLSYVFEGGETGDAAKDAVLYDNEQLIKATDMAIARSDPKDKAYQYYSEGEASASTEKWIKEYVKYGDRTTGRLRVFDRKVEVLKDGKATLSYCTDESKAFNKDLKTGKVDVSSPSKDSYVIYNTRLAKNAKGIWETESMYSERGAAQCQP